MLVSGDFFFLVSFEDKIDSFFLISSSIVLSSSFRVIVSKNPLNSIIALISVFFNSVIILLIHDIEFLAMIFLIVYIGAIAVLFLFVVYMLNIKSLELKELNSKYLWGLLFASIMLIFKYMFNLLNFSVINASSLIYDYNYINMLSYNILFVHNNLFGISVLLYDRYYIVLIILGIILLVAMLGSIILTSSKTVIIKEQNLFIQIKRLIK